MEITEQQIKDCYENKELLKELFPDVFINIPESGKYYIYPDGSIFYKNENGYDYGINSFGIWIYDINWYMHSCNGFFREATREEVGKALIAEAEKRGFKEGVNLDLRTVDKLFPRFASIKSNQYDFRLDKNFLSMDSYIVFKNGKWAEIIQETEIELTLDQIAEKFGVDKVKIKKD